MPTRSSYIQVLKTRGVGGPLSKKTKAELRQLVDDTAPAPSRPPTPEKGGICLEDDPHAQDGGKKKVAATQKPTKQAGADSGPAKQAGAGHTYRQYMSKHLKEHHGDMRAAAEAYRAQSGGSGARPAKEDTAAKENESPKKKRKKTSGCLLKSKTQRNPSSPSL